MQTSSVAFDYAKFPNKLSGVSQEREIERLGFLRVCIRKYTFVMNYFSIRQVKNPLNSNKLFLIELFIQC